MKYQLELVYESPMPDGGYRQSCVADEPYGHGALFYGQWGRAIVSKCYAMRDNITPKWVLLGRANKP